MRGPANAGATHGGDAASVERRRSGGNARPPPHTPTPRRQGGARIAPARCWLAGGPPRWRLQGGLQLAGPWLPVRSWVLGGWVGGAATGWGDGVVCRLVGRGVMSRARKRWRARGRALRQRSVAGSAGAGLALDCHLSGAADHAGATALVLSAGARARSRAAASRRHHRKRERCHLAPLVFRGTHALLVLHTHPSAMLHAPLQR